MEGEVLILAGEERLIEAESLEEGCHPELDRLRALRGEMEEGVEEYRRLLEEVQATIDDACYPDAADQKLDLADQKLSEIKVLEGELKCLEARVRTDVAEVLSAARELLGAVRHTHLERFSPKAAESAQRAYQEACAALNEGDLGPALQKAAYAKGQLQSSLKELRELRLGRHLETLSSLD